MAWKNIIVVFSANDLSSVNVMIMNRPIKYTLKGGTLTTEQQRECIVKQL